jgi:hypothetical protein
VFPEQRVEEFAKSNFNNLSLIVGFRYVIRRRKLCGSIGSGQEFENESFSEEARTIPSVAGEGSGHGSWVSRSGRRLPTSPPFFVRTEPPFQKIAPELEGVLHMTVDILAAPGAKLQFLQLFSSRHHLHSPAHHSKVSYG